MLLSYAFPGSLIEKRFITGLNKSRFSDESFSHPPFKKKKCPKAHKQLCVLCILKADGATQLISVECGPLSDRMLSGFRKRDAKSHWEHLMCSSISPSFPYFGCIFAVSDKYTLTFSQIASFGASECCVCNVADFPLCNSNWL